MWSKNETFVVEQGHWRKTGRVRERERERESERELGREAVRNKGLLCLASKRTWSLSLRLLSEVGIVHWFRVIAVNQRLPFINFMQRFCVAIPHTLKKNLAGRVKEKHGFPLQNIKNA